jgi:hypothetical protein
MQRALTAALLLTWFIAPARADMTLFLREVGNDVAMHLEGSIDTSVFNLGPGDARFDGPGSFTHSPFQIATSGGARGVGNETSVISGAVHGDRYWFVNDAAMTTVGTTPPLEPGSTNLSPAPPFWFGFFDVTQTSGTPGAIQDSVLLPDGYASNEHISLDYVARSESFATLGIARGDRWGVSFTGGAGGTQAIIFHAVTEPSTLGLPLLAGLALARRRSSHR